MFAFLFFGGVGKSGSTTVMPHAYTGHGAQVTIDSALSFSIMCLTPCFTSFSLNVATNK